MTKKLGRSTVAFGNPPCIRANACVAGKKEGEGPLGNSFDIVNNDTSFGEKSWEKAESRMQELVLAKALSKAALSPPDVDMIFAGDLLNQCIGSAFALKDAEIPYFRLYGACSTMAEGLILASAAVDGGFANRAAAMTSSHFCSAERQYRMPLEYGSQRTPTAQWTVTGAGCAIVTAEDLGGAYVTHACVGQIVDAGVKDAANMGAAMAPAAYRTITDILDQSGSAPEDFDLIVTGDLGFFGGELLREMFELDGVELLNHTDCGEMIFDRESQDVHAGGSGCGCSASVFCGEILNSMRAGRLARVLFAGTGALMSPVSTNQGSSIPCIAHAVIVSSTR